MHRMASASRLHRKNKLKLERSGTLKKLSDEQATKNKAIFTVFTTQQKAMDDIYVPV
jgi:hypothetical protein